MENHRCPDTCRSPPEGEHAINSDKRHGLETATRELRNGDKQLTSYRKSNDTGTFRNSDIPSFEIQTENVDNPPYRALSSQEYPAGWSRMNEFPVSFKYNSFARLTVDNVD